MIATGARLALLAATAAPLALWPAIAVAQKALTFADERYQLRVDDRRAAVPRVEYVRAGAAPDGGTKVLTIRHLAKEQDARAAAAAVARTVREENPNARAEVVGKDDGDALVDYIVRSQGDDRLELNVHHFRKVEGMPGLVAYRLAWRFRTTELADPTRTVTATRKRAIEAMSKGEAPNPFAAAR